MTRTKQILKSYNQYLQEYDNRMYNLDDYSLDSDSPQEFTSFHDEVLYTLQDEYNLPINELLDIIEMQNEI